MSDLDALIRDLGEFPRSGEKFVRSALEKSAHEAKGAWRDIASAASGTHAKGYPHKIDYDVTGSDMQWEAEVGPQLGGQGSLGILEDAPGGVRSAPQKARPAVVSKVAPDFERGMDRAVDDALRRVGL